MLQLRSTALLTLVFLLAAVPAAPAQVAHLSFQSPDAVLTRVRRVAELTGQDDLVKRLDGMRLLAGPKDIAGVDRGRPFGIYLVPVDQAAVGPVAFLPVIDEKKMVLTLRLMGVTVEDGPGGAHLLTTAEGVKLVLRFAHGHAHVALALTPLPERLPDPARFLPAEHRELIMGEVKVDRLERDLRRTLKGLAELALRMATNELGGTKNSLGGLKSGFQLAVTPDRRVNLKLDVDLRNSRLDLDVKVNSREQGRLSRLAGLATRLAGQVEVDVSLGDRGTLRLRLRAGNDAKK